MRLFNFNCLGVVFELYGLVDFKSFLFPLSMSQFHDVCYQTCCWKVSSCSFLVDNVKQICVYIICVCVGYAWTFFLRKLMMNM